MVFFRLGRFLLPLLCFAAGCSPAKRPTEPHNSQVLFVCEHGNVKSLMAASYFNRGARERGLSVRAIARGSAPNSNTVPSAIVQRLRTEGIDVSKFQPAIVTNSDVLASLKVITIGTSLPPDVKTVDDRPDEWTDVPPASLDYEGARKSLQRHIDKLLDDLTPP